MLICVGRGLRYSAHVKNKLMYLIFDISGNNIASSDSSILSSWNIWPDHWLLTTDCPLAVMDLSCLAHQWLTIRRAGRSKHHNGPGWSWSWSWWWGWGLSGKSCNQLEQPNIITMSFSSNGIIYIIHWQYNYYCNHLQQFIMPSGKKKRQCMWTKMKVSGFDFNQGSALLRII